MRRILLARLACLACLLWLGETVGFCEAPRLAVLVFSGEGRSQAVAQDFTSLTAARLVNSRKFEVVKPEAAERAAASMGGMSAMQSPVAIGDLGKALGCQYVVYGTVLGADVFTTQFSGYGVTSFKTQCGLRVDFKVLNAYDHRIVFSRTLEVSDEPTVQLNRPPGFNAPRFASLSKKALTDLESPMLASLDKDIRESAKALQQFLADKEPSAGAQKVTLRFESNVPSASVEVDGVIEGTCADPISVALGLHEVSIRARSYEPFSKKIRMTKDTVIPVELVRVKTSKK